MGERVGLQDRPGVMEATEQVREEELVRMGLMYGKGQRTHVELEEKA